MSRRSSGARSGRVRAVAGSAMCAAALLTACGSAPGSQGTISGAVVAVDVALTPGGCDPASLRLASGPTTFTATNRDAPAVSEFELLDGDRVLGEAENLTPGLSRSFTLTLEPGTYEMSCPGGTTDAVGALTVTGPAGSPAAAGPSGGPAADAVAVYRAYVERQADALVRRTRAFTAAILAGRIDEAKDLYATARAPYEAIEPIAESFGGLDPAIDARENDVAAGEAWTGFHRLEKALWVDRSLAEMAPIALKLRVDVERLRASIPDVDLEPAQIANGATELLNEVSNSKITGEEDRYAHTDLWDFQANVDGAEAAFAALAPLVRARDAALAAQISERFDAVDRALHPYRIGSGFALYTALSGTDTQTLAQAIDSLAEPLSRVAATVVGSG